MQLRCLFTAIAITLSATCSTCSTWAADPPEGSVSGTGNAEIKRSPEWLRVQMEIMVRGNNLADALEKLKARKAEATAAIEKLGPTKGSIVFGDADMVEEANNQQGQIERMMLQRNKALGKQPKPKTESPTVVAMSMKADFPLPSGSAEAMLVAAKTIQEKIKAADLGGLKTDEKASLEIEEQAEEALGGMNRDRGETPRGSPVFLYGIKITEEERSAALAKAFSNAKRDATRLAKAAGQSLGGLQKLVDQSQPGMDPEEFMMMQRREYGGYYRGGRSEAMIIGDDALSPSPGKVTIRLGVVAQFRLINSEK